MDTEGVNLGPCQVITATGDLIVKRWFAEKEGLV